MRVRGPDWIGGATGVLLALLWSIGCSSATGPRDLTHPNGVVYATPALTGSPYGVAISAGGDVLIAQVAGGVMSRYELPDTLPSSVLDLGLEPVHVAIDDANGRAYVVNQFAQKLHIVTLNPVQVVDSIPLTNDGFNLAVQPGGQRVYVTTADGRVYVVSTTTRTIIDSLKVGSVANGLAFSASGDLVYISSRDAGTITAFATATDVAVDTIVTTGAPQRLALSRDGATLFAANESYGINVISLRTGTIQPSIPLDGSGYGLAITPDGKQLYATNPGTGKVFIVDVASRQVVDTLAVGGSPRNVAFNRGGTVAVVTDANGRVIFIH